MTSPILRILDLARWAPSGDNTQPWRFSLGPDESLVVHGRDTRDHCVYDLDGRGTQIALGALLETIALAATRFDRTARILPRAGMPDDRPTFDVRFETVPGTVEHPLVAFIETRRVNRGWFRWQRLSSAEKSALEESIAPDYRILWFEAVADRARMASLNFTNARLRLTLPEAYRVHRDVIEWNASSSQDRIPDAALGASLPSLILMRWAMARWQRIDFLNRYLAGTVAPRIELDFLPGMACAAHCVLVARDEPTSLGEYISAGRAVQRFWLTADSLGLQFQPSYTPLIFARFAREGRKFAAAEHAFEAANKTRVALDRVLGVHASTRAVFMGRIGHGPAAAFRSVRLPLDALIRPS